MIHRNACDFQPVPVSLIPVPGPQAVDPPTTQHSSTTVDPPGTDSRPLAISVS